jgi:hypothetical protein
MYDALGVLLTQFTSVTAYTSSGVDLRTGTPRRGLKARVIISNYSGASAGHTWTPTVQGSSDNTTFYEIARAAPVTTGTAAATAVVFVPFETSYRYVRTVMALSGTTGTPTISYKADIGLTRPG